MQKTPDTLDQELDDALEMTFPASDPVAVVAPGSTSRQANARDDARDSADRAGVERGQRRKR